MSFLRKKPQALAEIHFQSSKNDDIHSSERRVWLSNEDIVGYAAFKLSPGVMFSHSKILLKGIVTTKTIENQTGGLQPQSWRTEKLPLLAVALESKTRPGSSSESGIVKIPFRFNLEECRRAAVVDELPPSVDSFEEGKWWSGLKNSNSRNQFNVTYSISASAFSNRGLITSTTHKIPVLPVTETQPPLSPSDFAGEYFLAATSPQEPKRLQRTFSHRIEVAGQEPEPILLDPSDSGMHGSTEIPFVVKLLPKIGGTLDQESFPDRCELKARLVTRTFVTPNGRNKTMPTMEDVIDDGDSYVRTFRSNEQAFTLAIPSWDQFAPNSPDSFAIAKFPFLFNVNSEKQLGPTFFTPILSRRHAIEIKLLFPHSSSSTLELSLPLQVVYGADDFGFVAAKFAK